MKISENWLKSWVNPNLSAQEMGQQLTMAGLEVDSIKKFAKDFLGVVVGKVLSLEQHPDADRLRVAMVDVGDLEPLQIVCGASNVSVGMKAAVAVVGAQLPSDDGKPFKIKKGKLRGVESQGMLCGGSEIDCDDGVDGLLVLPDDAPVGMNVRDYLGLDDHILDISVTPNRGDCLSIKGVARELAVINRLPFVLPFEPIEPPITSDECWQVTIQTDDCPRYIAQVVSNVSDAPSPDFIRQSLLKAGITPKNVLVDITNYVLMETGQPMHAFDADKLVGGICVRYANACETLTLLNGDTITLTGDELVICDEVGVIALAGIMGGERTMVSETTRRVVLESAFFTPLAIAGRARRFGLHTDASQRYERGVDFELPNLAIDRAVSLLVDHTKALVGQKTKAVRASALPDRPTISLPIEQIKRHLGVSIAPDVAMDILNRLEIKTVLDGDTLVATAPSHRYDIVIAEDLIEEIARIYGYDAIDNQLPKFASRFFEDIAENKATQIKNTLVAQGYLEAISFSFSDAKIEGLFYEPQKCAPLALTNPISSDLAVMRRTLLSSLLPCVIYNLKRQQSSVRLFEMGLCFDGESADTVAQREKLGIVAIGEMQGQTPWTHRPMDFYDLKATVESLLPARLLADGVSYERSAKPFLHSGQSAEVFVKGEAVGWFGQLHPQVAQSLGLPTTWVGELDVATLFGLDDKPLITPPSKFPQVRRDLAFLVDKSVTWQAMAQVVYQSAGTHCQRVQLFDVYEGEHLPDDKKSLAFAMFWQDNDSTLSDEVIKEAFEAVIIAVEQAFDAKLRDGVV